ncbi:M24 family metallopeptidase [Shouchella patagoniensis]|uniref:M24 family metallopeptidase n=1 Tax=Shouchella patagoniensis TaxID=228576 RepID=UPI00099553F2|nr:Xaa-Pro peptidase family protein [Shouchella patagoniensis]
MNRFQTRINNVRTYMKKHEMDSVLIFNPDHQYFLTGFKALMYSRPIILAIGENESTFVIPSLEEAHANHVAHVDRLHVYYEYEVEKGFTHYVDAVKQLVEGRFIKKVGTDKQTAPIGLLESIVSPTIEIADVSSFLVEARFCKDKEEIDAIRESSRWINKAVQVSLAHIQSGVSELEIDEKGNSYLYREIPKVHPEATIQLLGMSPSGKERSIMPHVFSNARKLEEGDVMIHTRQVGLNGYRTELERTVFIGKPTSEQERAFSAMLEAQLAAIEALKPGVRAGDIDDVARAILKREGYGEYAVHRTGHGIGLSPHEEPYVRFDNDLILEKDMVFTIEPGIYIPNVGGFRHSDTVAITDNGCEWLTNYPNTLEELCFPATK